MIFPLSSFCSHTTISLELCVSIYNFFIKLKYKLKKKQINGYPKPTGLWTESRFVRVSIGKWTAWISRREGRTSGNWRKRIRIHGSVSPSKGKCVLHLVAPRISLALQSSPIWVQLQQALGCRVVPIHRCGQDLGPLCTLDLLSWTGNR